MLQSDPDFLRNYGDLPCCTSIDVDTTVFPEGDGGPAQSGVECLIHQRPGNGMDILTYCPVSYPSAN